MPNYNIYLYIFVGDNETGKTSLVARLQGTEDPKKGAGLEYHYINVKDDYRDGQYTCNDVYIISLHVGNNR